MPHGKYSCCIIENCTVGIFTMASMVFATSMAKIIVCWWSFSQAAFFWLKMIHWNLIETNLGDSWSNACQVSCQVLIKKLSRGVKYDGIFQEIFFRVGFMWWLWVSDNFGSWSVEMAVFLWSFLFLSYDFSLIWCTLFTTCPYQTVKMTDSSNGYKIYINNAVQLAGKVVKRWFN